MRVDIVQMEIAARRQRAQAIAALVATAIAWMINHRPHLRHAARPHFAR
jgi:hypothetical protein